MIVELKVSAGPSQGRSVTFSSPGHYLIGSGELAHFRLAREEDAYISAGHAAIEVGLSTCKVLSLAGVNPLIVNREHVRERTLSNGDVVQLGLTKINVRIAVARCCYCGRTDDDFAESAEIDGRFGEFFEIAIYAHRNCFQPNPAYSGRTIGNYEIVERLGVGGFGAVWLVFEPRTGRLWAAKQMKGAADRRRFDREGRFLMQHSHPLLVRCVEIGEDDREGNYLICEFVSGRDLSHVARENGPLPLWWTTEVVIQTLACLHFLHTRPGSIIHRDIKPANILLKGEPGRLTMTKPACKLADLGIARALEGPGSTRYTQTGGLPGTLYYLSPEALSGQPYSPSTDVYSTGVTAYYSLSGQYPYDLPRGAEDAAILYHLSTNQPKPLRERLPEIDAAVAAVIDTACCKDPNGRYASAIEFARALARARPNPEELDTR